MIPKLIKFAVLFRCVLNYQYQTQNFVYDSIWAAKVYKVDLVKDFPAKSCGIEKQPASESCPLFVRCHWIAKTI